MDKQSRPELEDLVRAQRCVEPYQPADGYVEHAVSLLHAQKTWVAEDRAESSLRVERFW
jgi:hypothetical protein